MELVLSLAFEKNANVKFSQALSVFDGLGD
jgi:hypothetical protein